MPQRQWRSSGLLAMWKVTFPRAWLGLTGGRLSAKSGFLYCVAGEGVNSKLLKTLKILFLGLSPDAKNDVFSMATSKESLC